MKVFKILKNAPSDLLEGVVMPIRALFVVGIAALINVMTLAPSGRWWFHWVALGMGIAVLMSWGRALRAALVVGLVAFVGWKIYQRYGQAARERFDNWVQTARPKAAEVVRAMRQAA
jgi:mannose/fructose/N-acetylgalactosamine-specific phosphotransferase system component IIC